MPDAKEVLEHLEKENVFEAGDDVYCDKFGNGIVLRKYAIEANVNGKIEPKKFFIDVKFDGQTRPFTYLENGKLPQIFDGKVIYPEENVLHHGKIKKECKFKVGDRVYAPNFGKVGTVVACNSSIVAVILDENEQSGKVIDFRVDEVKLIDEDGFFIENVKDNPINPDHYKAEGIPEAIEIMRGLMTDEQLEGFLWGNIIKYAYRYGRKGDTQGAKTETAAKIKWYADAMIGYLSGH